MSYEYPHPGGEPIAEPMAPAPVTCRQSIPHTASGVISYQTDEKPGVPCRAPTEAEKADAADKAREALEAFGMAWCAKSKCSGTATGDCKPTVGDIAEAHYEVTREGKQCRLKATLSARIFCACR